MTPIPNHALRQLRAGKLAIGLGVNQARTVGIATMAKTAGFDWLFIDGEHGSLDGDTVAQISTAALAAGVSPIVRVAGFEHWHASRMLDNGAQGIVAPHVEDAAEARRIAEACLYPPLGRRSIPGAQPQLAFKAMPAAEATKLVNEQLLIVVMLESPRAIENAEAIAAVPGVDALLIGTSDLTAEMGILGQLGHERVEAAYRRVIDACRKHGKFPGMGGVYDPPLMDKYVKMGMRLILSGSDLALMMAAARERTTFLRKAAGEQ